MQLGGSDEVDGAGDASNFVSVEFYIGRGVLHRPRSHSHSPSAGLIQNASRPLHSVLS